MISSIFSVDQVSLTCQRLSTLSHGNYKSFYCVIFVNKQKQIGLKFIRTP